MKTASPAWLAGKPRVRKHHGRSQRDAGAEGRGVWLCFRSSVRRFFCSLCYTSRLRIQIVVQAVCHGHALAHSQRAGDELGNEGRRSRRLGRARWQRWDAVTQ